MDNTMTKDERNATDRLAALEQEVEETFREVCRVVSGEHSRWLLPDELRKLHELAVNEGRDVVGIANLARLALRHHGEAKAAFEKVAALRNRAGTAADAFRKKFEKLKEQLDEDGVRAAAFVQGQSHYPRFLTFILHLLETPDLIIHARHECDRRQKDDDLMRSMCEWNVTHDAGYWPRVGSSLNVIEELGRGMAAAQLHAIKELDIAEYEFEELIASRSKHYENKPWQEWPIVWSVADQQERAEQALALFARTFLAQGGHEHLEPGDHDQAYARRICRQHEKAVEQLTMARLEARVEALEVTLAGVASARLVKGSRRASEGKAKARKGRTK